MCLEHFDVGTHHRWKGRCCGYICFMKYYAGFCLQLWCCGFAESWWGGGEKANISVTLQTSIVNLFCIMTRKPLSHRDPAKRPHYNREFGLYPCAFCILHGTLWETISFFHIDPAKLQHNKRTAIWVCVFYAQLPSKVRKASFIQRLCKIDPLQL